MHDGAAFNIMMQLAQWVHRPLCSKRQTVQQVQQIEARTSWLTQLPFFNCDVVALQCLFKGLHQGRLVSSSVLQTCAIQHVR